MSKQTTTETQETTDSVDVKGTENSAETTMYPDKQEGSENPKDGDDSKSSSEDLDSEKGESGKKADETKEDGDSDKTDEPIKYDLKLPKDSMLNEGAVDEIAEFAKEQGLSNEQAQKLLDRENKAVKEYAESQVEGLKEKSSQWVEDVKNDKELGGENFNKNVELAHRALEKFGSKQLKETLNSSGLGSHPELVRVFSRIGKAMADDSIVNQGSEGSKQKTAEEIMYGGTKD